MPNNVVGGQVDQSVSGVPLLPDPDGAGAGPAETDLFPEGTASGKFISSGKLNFSTVVNPSVRPEIKEEVAR